eukprot:4876249-Prymnesium_polylepis.2
MKLAELPKLAEPKLVTKRMGDRRKFMTAEQMEAELRAGHSRVADARAKRLEEEKQAIIARIEQRLEQLLNDEKFRAAAESFDDRHHRYLRKSELALHMVPLPSPNPRTLLRGCSFFYR